MKSKQSRLVIGLLIAVTTYYSWWIFWSGDNFQTRSANAANREAIVRSYWRVPEIEGAVRHFVTAGATIVAPVRDVGEAIRVATVTDPFGNLIGSIENPHLKLPPDMDAV